MDRVLTGVGVLDKAMALVAEVEASTAASPSELQRRVGLSKTTGHRLLAALEIHGLLRRDAGGNYRLGSRFETPNLVQMASPVLRALSAETGESTQLFVRRGDMRLALVSVESEQELRTSIPVGSLGRLRPGGAGSLLLQEAIAVDRGWSTYVERNIAYVSAPILDGTRDVVAAICLSGPTERLTDNVIDRHAVRVVAAAAEMQRLMTP